MKERPILFSAPMVRAILCDRKTQTRRVVKPQPTHRLIEGVAHITAGMNPADDGQLWYDANCIHTGREVRCPYGRVGDRLWVRETWRITSNPDAPYSGLRIEYRAQGERYLEFSEYEACDKYVREAARWRPSIHMPRWASRLTLEITGVRVQKVQDISEDDAKAEGVPSLLPVADVRYRDAFRSLWDSINGKKFPWSSNPWVWVIEFKRLYGGDA